MMVDQVEQARVATLALAERLGQTEEEARATLQRARDPIACAQRLQRRARAEARAFERAHNRRTLERVHEASRERHRRDRCAARAKVKERRSRMSLGDRLDHALARARTLSGAEGAALGDPTGATPEAASAPPPRAAGTLYAGSSEAVFDLFTARARELIEELEREVDSVDFPSD